MRSQSTGGEYFHFSFVNLSDNENFTHPAKRGATYLADAMRKRIFSSFSKFKKKSSFAVDSLKFEIGKTKSNLLYSHEFFARMSVSNIWQHRISVDVIILFCKIVCMEWLFVNVWVHLIWVESDVQCVSIIAIRWVMSSPSIQWDAFNAGIYSIHYVNLNSRRKSKCNSWQDGMGVRLSAASIE